MKKKILVVDNDTMLLKVIRRKLEQEGHDVITAEDGLSALEVIISFVPDIMFIDLIMPNIDGKKLCQIIQKMPHMQNCYLVILSAAVAELAFDFASVGADACIAKGSFATTSEYILSEISKLDSPPEDKGSDTILGLENVYARQMTKELLSHNRHLETFLESTTQGILELFSEKIVYANTATASLCGLPEEMLLTLYPPDLFDGSARSQLESLIKTKNDEPMEIGNKSSITLNNRQVIITKLPVRDDAATTILLITDVTERKRIEHELRQSQKMEAVGTLAGGIAHDFNNILSAMIGYTELSLMDTPEDSKLRAKLLNVYKAGERATELVKQILTFSRQADTERKPLQLASIVNEVLKLMRSSLPATIQIKQDLGNDLHNILADTTQIHQIVMNLCTNAAHAMREHGGTLEVILENVTVDAEFSTQYTDIAPGLYLKMTVADTGHGMSPDIVDSIFDPYFTTKEQGEGTGMGLSVVHGIVTGNGGGIAVESEPGKGSTFSVYLPAIDVQTTEEPRSAEPLLSGHECILFIDDEPPLVDIGQEILETLGYRVVTRTSSIEALNLFRATPNRFDLVITDMTMPNMTGDKLAKELIAIRPDIPVILCTGYSDMITEQKAKEIGISEFIMKPIVARDLTNVVRQVLDQK
jgi:PAS domain S-box-containing protein